MPAFSYPTNLPALANEGAAIENAAGLIRSLFTSANMPLGSMTQFGMIAAGVAESLSGVSGGQQFIDVRQFGAWADGVNCTATLQAALNAAGTNTIAGTPYPLGVQMPALPDPLGGVLMSAGIGAAPIVIPSGVTLRGSGWKTHLTVDPLSMQTPAANYHVLDLIGATSGQNIIENFRIDGNKSNMNGGLLGQVGNIGIYCAPGNSNPGLFDVIIRGVIVHDIYNSVAGEAFGIFVGAGNTPGGRVLVTDCTAFNIAGTGFSTSGPNDTAPQGSPADTLFIACISHDNAWQGYTAFQAQYVQYVACRSINNTRAGFNCERADSIEYVGCRARTNGFNGLQLLGICSNIHWQGGSLEGNNTVASAEGAEISMGQGGGTHIGYPTSVWIDNAHVVPTTGTGGHLQVGDGTSGNTAGQPSFVTADEAAVPFKGIMVSGPDIDKWIYLRNSTPFNTKYAPLGLYLRPGTSGSSGVATGHPSTWTLTNITVTAAPSGALSVGTTNTAKTFTQTAANTTTSAISATALVPGRRFLVHYRIKIIDANATWELATNSQIKQVRFFTNTNDLGVWAEGDFIFQVPVNFATNFLQLTTVVNTASASALGVDYVTCSLLPWLGAVSGS